MALCTALSSSTFDVLICLGVPWFIKAMWFHKANSSASLTVHSRSLDDSAIAVMISTIGFMLLMYGKKFILTKRVRTEVFIIFVFIIILSWWLWFGLSYFILIFFCFLFLQSGGFLVFMWILVCSAMVYNEYTTRPL